MTSYARDWQHYTPRYYAMLDFFALSQPGAYVLNCDTAQQAFAVRADIYRFFAALRRQQAKFKDKDVSSHDAVMCHNWANTADTLTMAIQGKDVVVRRRPFAEAPRIREYNPMAVGQPPSITTDGDK